MAKFRIQHTTRYIYEEAVRDSANQIMLYPIVDQYQEIIQHVLTISGNPTVNVHEDFFGNKVGTFTYAQPHSEMIIHSQLNVETRERKLPTDEVPFTRQWAELQSLCNNIDYIDFFTIERFSAISEVEKIVDAERCLNCTPLETAKHFNKYVFDSFAYRKGITTVETTLEEIWKLKSGVCQDFAHMLLAMLRLINIPARYVSGYICPNKNGMRGEGATHAWVEAYLPYYGWLGLDPTNNCLANESHVRLAVGKGFSDCSPVKGTYRGTSNHTLEVGVTVSYEDGKTTGDDSVATPEVETVSTSAYKNSFRRHQEMQMQQ
ncbi:MAG TPA: transglutaminase family protein [Cyclobacteriaceae bacterium]|nr:transglutaminase family protein [Cyclobacteriaceae bacterium]